MHYSRRWINQCRAARVIRERFGVKNALDYLIGEKLIDFAAVAKRDQEFSKELPRFRAEVLSVFAQQEVAEYIATFRGTKRAQAKEALGWKP